jgi:hypothetical protein
MGSIVDVTRAIGTHAHPRRAGRWRMAVVGKVVEAAASAPAGATSTGCGDGASLGESPEGQRWRDARPGVASFAPVPAAYECTIGEARDNGRISCFGDKSIHSPIERSHILDAMVANRASTAASARVSADAIFASLVDAGLGSCWPRVR